MVHTFGRLIDGKGKSKAAFVVFDNHGGVLHHEAEVIAPPPAPTEIRGMLVSWLACERALIWLLHHRDKVPGRVALHVDIEQLAGYISWKSRALHPAYQATAASIDALCTALSIDQAKKVSSGKNKARF